MRLRAMIARALRAQRFWRITFWAYLPLLFTLTHWPALQVPVPGVERPDLIAHFVSFGTWCGLFTLAGFLAPRGPTTSPKAFATLRWIGLSWLVSVAYAALDEGLQAIPALQRTCAWDDWFANVGGVTLGSLACVVLVLLARVPSVRSPAR